MIVGRLVALTAFIPDDFPQLFRWANDVEAARLNGPYRPADWQLHKDWCEAVGRDPGKVLFAIRKAGTAPVIGYVQILNIHTVNRSAELGIRIGEVLDRGRGYGSEALSLAVDYCWNHLNLRRVALSVFQDNIRAVGLYRAQGFHEEGVLRRAVYVDGQWVNVVLMAKLRFDD